MSSPIPNCNVPVSVDLPVQSISIGLLLPDVLSDVVKEILYKRMQIPETVQGMEKMLNAHCSVDYSNDDANASKEKRLKLFQKRKQQKYLKQSKEIVCKMDEFHRSLVFAINNFKITELIIAIGATPISLKEVLHFKLPEYNTLGPIQQRKLLTSRCTRKILFLLLQHKFPRNINVTSTHVFIKSLYINSNDWIPWPRFQLPLKKTVLSFEMNCTDQPSFAFHCDYACQEREETNKVMDEKKMDLPSAPLLQRSSKISVEDALEMIVQENSPSFSEQEDDMVSFDVVLNSKTKPVTTTSTDPCNIAINNKQPIWFKSAFVFKGFNI